jgi:hypothetical protein
LVRYIDLKGCSFGIQFSSLLTQIHLATLIYLYLIPLLLEVFGIGMNVSEPPLFDKIFLIHFLGYTLTCLLNVMFVMTCWLVVCVAWEGVCVVA